MKRFTWIGLPLVLGLLLLAGMSWWPQAAMKQRCCSLDCLPPGSLCCTRSLVILDKSRSAKGGRYFVGDE